MNKKLVVIILLFLPLTTQANNISNDSNSITKPLNKITESNVSSEIKKIFQQQHIRGVLTIYDGKSINNYGDQIKRAATQYVPASTFKIVNALIALKNQKVTVNEIFKWDGQPRYLSSWKRCYELTPQLREYDEFMYLSVRWLPYTMFFHQKNYRSAVINNDEMGFRMSKSFSGWVSPANFPTDELVNIVIGGSTAMGTGATSDAYTISSILSKLTGEIWLNFGGGGYNCVQEAILFMLNQHRFKKIKNIIILSGLSTLTFEGLPDNFTTEYGKYYYSYELVHYMNKYNEDLAYRINSNPPCNNSAAKKFIPKLAERLNNWLDDLAQNPMEKVFTDTYVDIKKRLNRAVKMTVESAVQIKQLAKKHDAKVYYILQPLSRWSKERFHKDEEEMFYTMNACANKFWQLFDHLCALDLHKKYSSQLEAGCQKDNIPYYDMNFLMRLSPKLHDNIYVDHLHFNNLGYGEMGRLIYEKILN